MKMGKRTPQTMSTLCTVGNCISPPLAACEIKKINNKNKVLEK